jgi:PAS domain S-box-containing protein
VTDVATVAGLAELGRAAGQASDVPALFAALARALPEDDGPLALRALFASHQDEGSVVPCLFAADRVDGRLHRVRQEFDVTALDGAAAHEGSAVLEADRLQRAHAGVPGWARSGVWLPTPGARPAMAGLVVLTARDDGLPSEVRGLHEAAVEIVAGHVNRLLAPATGVVPSDAVGGAGDDGAAGVTAVPAQLATRLAAENDPFKALIEHSHDATLLMDREATILYASPAAERILGIPAPAQVGQWGLGLVHPDDLPALTSLFERVQERHGAVLRGEGRVRSTDGSWRWLAVTATNLLEDPDVRAVVVNYADVTEQVAARHALERTERRWRALVHHSPDVMVLVDRRGAIRYVNEAVSTAAGYRPDELEGGDAFDLVHEGDRDPIRSTFARLVEDGEPSRVSYRLKHKDGSWRWWEAVASRLFDDEGHPEVVVNARDVTERRRALDEAERQRNLLSAALDALPGPFYLFDEKGRYVLWNDALERATGMGPEAIAQARPVDFVPEVDRDEVARAIETTLATGDGTVEARLRTASGVEVPHLFTGRRVEIDGRPHLVGMGVDVSERVEAQRRTAFQARLLEQVHSAILATDRNDRVVYWNPAAERLFGWTGEEALGRPIDDLTVTGDTIQRRPAIFEELWATGSWTGVVDARDNAGSIFPIRVTVARISGSQGDTTGFVTVADDDSARQRHERERQRLLDQLGERVKELRMLHDAGRILEDEDAAMADIVHDLAERMRGAWQFPDDTAARVEVDGDVGETQGFTRTPWVQEEHLATVHGTALRIELAYLHEHEEADEGPFLDEERSMLASLIQMLRSYVERRYEREVSARLAEQLGHQVDRLAALQRIDAAIIASNNLSSTLDVVFEQVQRELGVDAVDVLLFDREREMLVYSHGVGFLTGEIETSRLAVGEGYAGRAAKERAPVFLPDARVADPPFVRQALLAREGFVSYVALPLVAQDELKGVLGVFHRERLEPDDTWWDFASALSQQTAIAIDNWRLLADVFEANGALEAAYDATIEGWARALDLRDEETAGHSQRVTQMTVALARRFGIAGDELRFVRWGALLHDIGKMGVPDRILLKPGKLDDEEWAAMQRHTVYARDLLLPIAFLKNAVDIPYLHHERFDGSGYPEGLAGTDIPLPARIFAIVDVYDALTSDRPYRAAWSHEDAMAHIREQSGRHFCPEVVRTFLAYMGSEPPEGKGRGRGDPS